MKRCVIALVATLLFTFTGFTQARKLQDMRGIWEIAGEQNATLEIIDSANIFLTYMGETKKISNLKTDFTKSPYWFDFTTTDTASVIQVKSLLETAGDSMLKWQLFIDEERSAFFTASRGEIFYLKKRPALTTATARTN